MSGRFTSDLRWIRASYSQASGSAAWRRQLSGQQVERLLEGTVSPYTFRMPGQAPSYFYGYTRWMQLRAQAEIALRDAFDRQRYHDFILSQGLLSPDVLGRAVMAEFVPGEKARRR